MSSDIQNCNRIPVGKAEDLTNKKFGRLVPLYRVEAPRTSWLCQCECGNKIIVSSRALKTGNTKSCGCYRKETAKKNTQKNLVGQKFGYLTVIKDSTKRKNNRIIWECLCDCGNITYVTTNDLTQGNTKSCGCLHKNFISNLTRKDLTNCRFGRLTALYPTDERVDKKIVWHCKCDCGRECNVVSTKLISKSTLSCGCLRMSIGEALIAEVLTNNKIVYYQEYKFQDLGNLRYDFYLPEYNRLIEFDGEQHFRDTGWGDLKSYRERDKIKNNYAKSHNISLIRIPYWEKDKINLEMLLGDKYLIKE